MNTNCETVEDRLADAIDGTLPDDLAAHVIECDECRDRIHDATFVIDEIRALGGDHAPRVDLEERILAAIDARAPRTAVVTPFVSRRRVGAALAIAAAVTVGAIALRSPRVAPPALAASPWTGTVHHVTGNRDGVTVDGRVAHAGEGIAAGSVVRTDARTRAKITLNDGTFILLDRGAELALDSHASRAARLAHGSVVVDATSSEAPARISSGSTAIETPGAKLAIATLGSSTSLALARGRASVEGTALTAGEGATFGNGAPIVRTGGLASAFGWSEAMDEVDTGGEANVPGIGVLRARLPGATGDGDQALRLTQQKVTVKIAGDIARTEVEGTFHSDDARILEGIFRFPLPADAQIERLALDVDGKMEEGSFVDKAKGSAIWKGVLFHATPQQPQPKEEWIWVQGPWHDPALLEWRAGGRMELKIFPIPAHGSRRVVLAYTQQLAKSGGVRRYVYPLPHFGDAQSKIEEFVLEAQSPEPMVVRGYETAVAGTQHSLRRTSFSPSGDFVLEIARGDDGAAAHTWAYRSTPSEQAFVALSLSPRIPRAPDTATRTHTIVVDASRSMVGERWSRAVALATRVVAEMDPRDRFAVLACDVSCVPLSVALDTPGKKASDAVRTFLTGLTPEGASDPVAALQAAAVLAKSAAGRSPRVIYIGDGAATVGARAPMALERGARAALGEAALTAVAIGVDADLASLDALARGGGGVVVPYSAGQSLGAAALDVLESSYGVALRDPTIELPSGLEAMAPAKLGAIRAGSDVSLTARMTGSEIKGDAKLSGMLGGKSWSTTIPIAVRASSEPRNAFVPRLWATATVTDLERHGGDRAKIVGLSKTFSVPSRYTSLLVLESPAMAAAFGVEPRSKIYEWTGDALPSDVTTAHAALGRASPMDAMGGGFAAPAATMAGPAMAAPKPVLEKAADDEMPAKKGKMPVGLGMGQWMRREWFRTATFTTTPETDLETKILAARSAVISTPDSRDKLESLFGLVSRRDSLEEAKTVMSTWVQRDPLDLPATLRRSELALREGNRAHALRVLTGALDSKPDDVTLADGIAEVALRAGESKLACALYSVHVEARPNDIDAVAKRVACLRDSGDEVGVSTVLDSIDAARHVAVEARVPAMRALKPAIAWGDLTVRGSWTGADLDLVVVDPKGSRLSWLSPTGVRASDAYSTTSETLAVPWAGAGGWTIEVTRANSDTPASGTVTVQLLGETRTLPFTLQGNRAFVGRVNVGWSSRLVPAEWQ